MEYIGGVVAISKYKHKRWLCTSQLLSNTPAIVGRRVVGGFLWYLSIQNSKQETLYEKLQYTHHA